MGWHEQALAWGEKYRKILGTTEGRMPIFKLANNIKSKWLGICVLAGVPKGMPFPDFTTITLQKSVTEDPRTMERVVAHEMVHNHAFMHMTREEEALIRVGVRTDGHGEDFLKLAGKINAVMGKDFVTKTSDSEYVLSKEVKRYFVYMEPTDDGIAYGWAVRLSPQAQRLLARRIPHYKGKLVETTDRRFTNCEGKIGSSIRLCHSKPPLSANYPYLTKLYDEGAPSAMMMALAPQLGGAFRPSDVLNRMRDSGMIQAPAEPAPKPKPPEPKLHGFAPGAKQGKLF